MSMATRFFLERWLFEALRPKVSPASGRVFSDCGGYCCRPASSSGGASRRCQPGRDPEDRTGDRRMCACQTSETLLTHAAMRDCAWLRGAKWARLGSNQRPPACERCADGACRGQEGTIGPYSSARRAPFLRSPALLTKTHQIGPLVDAVPAFCDSLAGPEVSSLSRAQSGGSGTRVNQSSSAIFLLADLC
jgi:hypothetical protein